MGLDSSQACINFCSGYSVFLEAHLQAIINSLECWQNIQTCRQASDDTALGKSSGSGPSSEQGGGDGEVCSTESPAKWLLFTVHPLSAPRHPRRPKGRPWASEPHTSDLPHHPQTPHRAHPEGMLEELKALRKVPPGYLQALP